MKRLKSHLLYCKLQLLQKHRLKRKSLIHQGKELQRQNADILQPSQNQCEPLTNPVWSAEKLGAEIWISIPGPLSEDFHQRRLVLTAKLTHMEESHIRTDIKGAERFNWNDITKTSKNTV